MIAGGMILSGPWLQGITLDPSLNVDSADITSYIASFIAGPAILPSGGMRQLVKHLARQLPEGTVRCQAPVKHVTPHSIILRDDQEVAASAVVVATDGDQAHLWKQGYEPDQQEDTGAQTTVKPIQSTGRPWRTAQVFHFAIHNPSDLQQENLKNRGRWLHLNALHQTIPNLGLINSVVFPSQVTSGYAPVGKELASVAILPQSKQTINHTNETSTGQQTVQAEQAVTVKQHLQSWWPQAEGWDCIAAHTVHRALPDYRQDWSQPTQQGWYCCGDHTSRPGIGAAMRSGLKIARHIQQHILLTG